jgi:ribosomal protein S18
MKTKEKKEFKAVKFQRQRRDELSDLYNSNPIEFWKRLELIRKKYISKFAQKQEHTA